MSDPFARALAADRRLMEKAGLTEDIIVSVLAYKPHEKLWKRFHKVVIQPEERGCWVDFEKRQIVYPTFTPEKEKWLWERFDQQRYETCSNMLYDHLEDTLSPCSVSFGSMLRALPTEQWTTIPVPKKRECPGCGKERPPTYQENDEDRCRACDSVVTFW